MKKTAKRLRGVRRAELAPPPRKNAPLIKLKKKPRGRPFQPGNRFGISTQFKAGNSANPEGRPSLKKLNEACRDVLARIVPREELKAAGLPIHLFGATYAELNAWVLAQEGMRGSISAVEALGDRAEGKPAVTVISDGAPEALDLLLSEFTRISIVAGPPEGFIPMRRKGENDEEQESDERAGGEDVGEVASGNK